MSGKRLIETAFPLAEASAASLHEKKHSTRVYLDASSVAGPSAACGLARGDCRSAVAGSRRKRRAPDNGAKAWR
jgi:hypothetical protein